ncbi:GDP-mannose 4,6-dehydratase [Candidatus Aerophobetes bacterium]|nr:GDP-mannose 4,6-dehydratase [Candidatus Aerophobetes bacterium]
MQKALISGVAGFIGSHLAERLIKEGFSVIGIDSFEDYYPRWIKEKNLEALRKSSHFTFIEATLLSSGVFTQPLLQDTEYIFHQAAQAGVRKSWGNSFQAYTTNNILATQKLLEFAKTLPSLKKFIFASSSSVYGNSPLLPIGEDASLEPISPYGVTKLAAENLCCLYWKNFQIPTVSLRYFTVYGPRQRPDMAFHRFIKAALSGKPITLYGDGRQTRDFTFVEDVVVANLLALNASAGEVFNIGSGAKVTLIYAISILESIIKHRIKLNKTSPQKGDAQNTFASIEKAQKVLGYQPKKALDEGLHEEIFWIKELYNL